MITLYNNTPPGICWSCVTVSARGKFFMLTRYCNPALIVCLCGLPLAAQDPPVPAADSPERWNLYYQATSIGQHHDAFYSPYQGPLSLVGHPETEASLTTTLFFGLN